MRRRADLRIFTGRVASAIEHDHYTTYIFEVNESFRGVNSTRVEIIASREEYCGREFTVNSEYLVYAQNSGGSLSAGMCNPSKLLRDAAADLRYIRRFGKKYWNAAEEPR